MQHGTLKYSNIAFMGDGKGKKKKAFMQKEQLFFKNILNTKQTSLKQIQQPLLQNQQNSASVSVHFAQKGC